MSDGETQEAAAAAAGMSVRSARKWQKGATPSELPRERGWRTRPDPFSEVWDTLLVPLLRDDEAQTLEATTLLEVLRTHHKDRFHGGHLRSLQRRIRAWRALEGPGRDVTFAQVHPPGREAAFDFTHATELGVTVGGVLLRHLFFVLVLPFSGWSWVMLAFGETFEAMLEGIQGALWALGGVPQVLRSDNLSAATHELARTGGRRLTARYTALLEHYGARSTRINAGESHENGSVESRNRWFKSDLAQALLVRGHKDFEDLDAYRDFYQEVHAAGQRRRVRARLVEEREALRPLPSVPLPAYTVVQARVSRWSTVEIGKRIYSVPSRLIGHKVRVVLRPERVEVYYSGRLTETITRLHGGHNAVRVNYRHIIWSLVRKPGAFARYRYREELFPTVVFRRAYDALCAHHGARADVEYVRVLHLAAGTVEADVEAALEALLAQGGAFDYAGVRALAAPTRPTVPRIEVGTPDPGVYDRLLAGGAR
ncbi:MAG: IS21 family transposase [Deltaproteobacteria bacterium]|nr:IS21 family transposase [Deltaproteobacteria bacterium]